MTASVASKEFGKYMDEVQHEPVVITRQNRPIALTISMREAEKFLQYKIEAGIQRGLDDITAGNYAEMTPDYIREMKQWFISEQV